MKWRWADDSDLRWAGRSCDRTGVRTPRTSPLRVPAVESGTVPPWVSHQLDRGQRDARRYDCRARVVTRPECHKRRVHTLRRDGWPCAVHLDPDWPGGSRFNRKSGWPGSPIGEPALPRRESYGWIPIQSEQAVPGMDCAREWTTNPGYAHYE